MTDVYAEEERLRSYLTAKEEDFYVAAEQEYYDGLLNSMTPHERKHALKPSRMDLKGGHRHNHIRNAQKRMRKCHICGEPIVWGCEFTDGFSEFQCRSCRTEECIEQACLVGLSFSGCEFKTRRRRK